ncbi:MAG: hypothetical protein L3J28_15070 [Candidatus Polarisedimenticolaceae bacterium]|nr:hypothetical protein [Candidatus Polarisedimenticolaceae bacterium]
MSVQITKLVVDGRGRGAGRSMSVHALLLLSSLFLPQLLIAAPGIISDNPLFLQSGIQPNIFFILDDSGSMDEEILLSKGALAAYPGSQNGGHLNFVPESDEQRLEHCAGYNVLAYDPNVEYAPWRGLDHAGHSFQDQTPSSAHMNPYTGGAGEGACSAEVSNANGDVCNLLTAWSVEGDEASGGGFYYLWDDANENGLFDADECPAATSDDDPKYVKNQPITPSSDSPHSQTNYANWFSYYRKREYVVKRAVSQVIEASQERMGLATINRNDRVLDSLLSRHTEAVGTPVMDIDDLSAPINLDAQQNKKILLDNLLAIDSSGFTPLRQALQNTGRYFQGEMGDNTLFDYVPSAALNSANNSSPILDLEHGGQCQQNFALLFSDGYWNGTAAPDGIGNTDQAGGAYDGRSYADTYSDTLADVAMHYYEIDLMPDLVDDVEPVALKVGFDDNQSQHLTTFTIAFGVNGSVSCDPVDRETSLADQEWPDECEGYSAWPDPTTNLTHKIDDMRHAAWNGRGQFMNASNSKDLIKQLQAVIEEIARRSTSSAAAVTTNAGQFQQGDTIYRSEFSSTTWAGYLSAVELTSDGIGEVIWNAHELLDDRDLGANARTIITYNGENGVDFKFPDGGHFGDDNLSWQQVEDLLHDAPNRASASRGEAWRENVDYGRRLVAYLRGDRGDEDDLFRKRAGRLGDIIYSSPRYVGAPDITSYPNYIAGSDNAYKTWASGSVKERTPMLYIGSNDGMLHAFEAETGEESFAYIPEAVFSSDDEAGLHWLADKLYGHRAYVDQTPTVMDAFIHTPNDSTEEWRTVLVGGLRSGGKALFALDVTDPDEFEPSDVLWEFSHDDLGYTFSRPAIVKLNNGDWAAIFGNGYNSDPDGDGSAKLFIVNLATGDLIREPLSTNVGSMEDGDCGNIDSDCNGLATPATIDTSGDGIVDRVYVGDLKGNMWVFDLSDSNPSNWGSAYGSSAPAPLFTAVDGAGNHQPITTQPRLAMHATERGRATRPNIMVYFGTGQYLADADISNIEQQSFYAIWDSGSTITRSHLLEQTITEYDGEVRTMSDELIAYGTHHDEHRGWFTDLSSASGERVIVTPIIFGKLVVYTTIIPEHELCGSKGGSWLMVHDLIDGGRPDYIAIDVNHDTNFDADDQQDGVNVSGVKSGELQWQPTILGGGDGTGRIVGQNDTGGLDERLLKSGRNSSSDASWARFDF